MRGLLFVAVVAVVVVAVVAGCGVPPPGGNCTGRMCGPNSAGSGSCGTCLSTETCTGSGACLAAGCTAGSSRACACPAGTAMGSGTQTCQSDGTYDTCAPCAPCTCGSRTCGSDTCGANVCGMCTGGFRCNGAGACEIEPTTQWVVTATTAMISQRDCAGDTWDSFGGLPDPEICVDSTVSTAIMYGTKHCTPPVSDVTTATWSSRNTFTIPASTLTAGMVVELADNEAPFGGGQPVCRGPVAITETNLRARSVVIPCTCPAGSVNAGATAGSMTFTFAPR